MSTTYSEIQHAYGPEVPRLAYPEWRALGTSLFGENIMAWRFVCPNCGHVCSVQEMKDAGAPEGAVGFSCIGRFLPGTTGTIGNGQSPCNYTLGGLISLAKAIVVMDTGRERPCFEFAPATITGRDV